jgi:hypothetical protein
MSLILHIIAEVFLIGAGRRPAAGAIGNPALLAQEELVKWIDGESDQQVALTRRLKKGTAVQPFYWIAK